MARDVFEAVEVAVLFAAAVAALAAWRSLQRSPARSEFWLLAGLGALYLMFDEALGVHEKLGSWLYDRGVKEPPGINHLDDLIVIGIGIAGLAVTAVYWRELWRNPTVLRLFIASGILFAIATIWDATRSPDATLNWWTEELLEFAGGVSMLGAFTVRWRTARRTIPLYGTLIRGAGGTG